MAELSAGLALVFLTGSFLAVMIYFCRYLLISFKASKSREIYRQQAQAFRELDNVIKAGVSGTFARKRLQEPDSSGSIPRSDMEEVCRDAFENIRNIMHQDKLSQLEGLLGDLDEWIESRIQVHIRRNG